MEMCLLQVLVLLLLNCALLSRAHVLPHEPTAVIKSRLVPTDPANVEKWRPLQGSDENGTFARIRAAMLATLADDTAFFIATEGRVKMEHFPKGVKWDSSLVLPGANALSLLSTSINIIFDSFKAEVMTKKLGDLMKAGDKKKVEGFESLSLLDIVNSTPENNEDILKELESRSRVFVDVANTLLGKTAVEAWRDTFLSLGLDNSIFSGHNIVTSSHDLFIFTKLILSELRAAAQVEGLATRGQFAFGWWLNCDTKGKCLVPALPSNTIFTFTPAFRMYILLDVDIAVVIADLPNLDKHDKARSTFTQAIHRDAQLWKDISEAIGETLSEDDLMLEAEDKFPDESNIQDNSEIVLPEPLQCIVDLFWNGLSMYMEFTSRQHILVRGVLWILFLGTGHLVVYWGMHITWFIGSFIFPRLYTRRPKSAKVD